MVLRVQGAVVDAAEETEQVERVDPAAPGDAVLAVGREDEVLGAQGATGRRSARLLASSCAQMPSSPWRWSAVASVSMRRVSTMSR